MFADYEEILSDFSYGLEELLLVLKESVERLAQLDVLRLCVCVCV